MLSAPAGKTTAPSAERSTVSKRLPAAVGSVGSTAVRLVATAFEVFCTPMVRFDSSPTLNCVELGAQLAVVAMPVLYGTVIVVVAVADLGAASVAVMSAVLVIGTPLDGQSGVSPPGTVSEN